MKKLVIIAHNLRSAHNVGSLLRTAEGMGVDRVYLTGYTPYPKVQNDQRIPYLANKIHRQITKTALGAEEVIPVLHEEDIFIVIKDLQAEGFKVVALEQDTRSSNIKSFKPQEDVALVLGREVEGIEQEVINICDQVIEIPMLGKKESFNVVQAAAMALYHLRFVA